MFNLSSYVFTVTLGATILGILTGFIGSFSYVRSENLLGDALSHSALPGLALAFLLLETKSRPVLLLGAVISGLIGMVFILKIVRNSKLKLDSGLALVLSTFFGFGLILLSYIQRNFGEEQAGLESYVFGQAAVFMKQDLILVTIGLIVVVTVVLLFYKEFKLLSFDSAYMRSLGLPVDKLQLLLNGLLILSIVLGLQTVGVILMSAMLIGPASASRLWTNNFAKMLTLSAIIGGISGCLGTLISVQYRLPTGPSIVLLLMMLVLLSFLFAPNKGFIAEKKRKRDLAQYVAEQSLLTHIEDLKNPKGYTTVEDLLEHKKYQNYSRDTLENRLNILLKQGKIKVVENGYVIRKEA